MSKCVFEGWIYWPATKHSPPQGHNHLFSADTDAAFMQPLLISKCFWQCLVEFKPFQSSNICIYPLRNRNVPGFDSFGDGDAGDG